MGNEKFKILIVDDEKDVLEFLSYNLKKEGYQTFTASTGKQALEQSKENTPHLIILDLIMPKMDGIEACAELRKLPQLKNTIIVFLTARGEDYSQIAGFEAGADDYITKPIKPKVLISRIKALLRRYKEEDKADDLIQFKDFTIDKEKYVIIKDDKVISLPKKEFELLLLLTSKPNKVFSREEIFANVWDSNVIVGDRTIDVHIRKVREKIGIENIKTVKGIGYKYEA